MSHEVCTTTCQLSGGWFSGDMCKSMWPHANTWYWAKDRLTELIIGTGKLVPDQNFNWHFYINGERYEAHHFDFAKACVPDCLQKTHLIRSNVDS